MDGVDKVNPGPDAVRMQLDKVLASHVFQGSARASALLRYIVEKSLEGRAGDLKESTIGVAVFGKEPTFDAGADAGVRVEAGRLRAKLETYYAGNGRDDSIVITIPKGGYRAEFAQREPSGRMPAGEQGRFVGAGAVAPQSPCYVRRVAGWRVTVVLILRAGAGWLLHRQLDAGSGAPPRIAVLPFTEYSGSAAARQSARRLTERVTLQLVATGALRVVPSASTLHYANVDYALPDVARELAADYIVQGRLIEEAPRLRIEAVLIDVGANEKFWVDDSLAGTEVTGVAALLAERIAQHVAKREASRQRTDWPPATRAALPGQSVASFSASSNGSAALKMNP